MPEILKKPSGRPRDAKKDKAIKKAMLSMLVAHGYEGASYEKVAAAAGVTRPAIYRRWPSKEHLVTDAVLQVLQADTKISGYENLHRMPAIYSMVESVARRLRDSFLSRVVTVIVSEAVCRPALAALLRSQENERREPLRRALHEAVSAGDIPPVENQELVIDALLGAVYFRKLISHEPTTETMSKQIADSVLGFRKKAKSKGA